SALGSDAAARRPPRAGPPPPAARQHSTQRIVEFLNSQMRPAEVFAVEVKQYAAAGVAGRTIVPRVIGRIASAMTKQGSGKTLLTAQQYRDRAAPPTVQLGERLAEWATRHELQL